MSRLSLNDIEIWRSELGLLPIPLYNDKDNQQPFVLLNGMRGNFCLDLRKGFLGDETRNVAWSSNVGHYIGVSDDYIEVQRWDRKKSVLERYSQKSIQDDLEKFHSYLERDNPPQDISIVSHAIQVFRSLRAVLGNEFSGAQSLKAFLYLLASVTEERELDQRLLNQWGLDTEVVGIIASVKSDLWDTLRDELVQGRPIDSLTPKFQLLLRHVSGQLFQEAHYEAIFFNSRQLTLSGFLPLPVQIYKGHTAVGLHFTPPALARSLVEEALLNLTLTATSLTIFDPACGSGEFLREVLRQLKLKLYKGTVNIIGWDISEAACDMARFTLACETRDSTIRTTTNIQCVDSLALEQPWPKGVDLVLMNPPFMSWENMSSEQREKVAFTLNEIKMERTDLSHAFLWKSSLCLRTGGVLATVLPASILETNSAERLRKELSQIMTPKLIARLGSQQLFPGAIVDATFYVAKKGEDSDEPVISFWADQRSSSNSTGLRMLRRIRGLDKKRVYPIIEDGFSIYQNPELGRNSSSWAPRPYESWQLIQNLQHHCKVSSLFDIRQGVRTGYKQAFLLTKDSWEKLPESERPFFRPAVVNKSIQYGFLKNIYYIFYPYGKATINNEEELSDILGTYYKSYLLPNKQKLIDRPRVKKWWELSEYRAWQLELGANSKLVSTYFGASGSFAWDEIGEFVVVQGFAWIPIIPAKTNSTYRKINLAYLSILNSSLFSKLLAAISPQVAGGQWNLSKMYIDQMPIPDLFTNQFDNTLIENLALIGEHIYKGEKVDNYHLDNLVRDIYGV